MTLSPSSRPNSPTKRPLLKRRTFSGAPLRRSLTAPSSPTAEVDLNSVPAPLSPPLLPMPRLEMSRCRTEPWQGDGASPPGIPITRASMAFSRGLTKATQPSAYPEILETQRETLELLRGSMERALTSVERAESRYVQTKQHLNTHIHMVQEMWTDLREIFRRISVLKEAVKQNHPTAHILALQIYPPMSGEEGEEEDEN
ncbi:hypothetical protein BJ684DRAFT_19640 [Piptocephalis cylindrospora]|uniref:KxDL domain-containing protein n=1 Tax=Piptocephalis cylindrospora TaxID=1907219 RepID=A0A4P9Y4P1_9FUNG|nr:hypothetical protein BJ684DRAFT_19640 [Piptocephalis cylindrospora]|eukprot:RKP13907.1 hypothetical protein BJ684DRAFT_19640 [Piptocephalis cylindrospora]